MKKRAKTNPLNYRPISLLPIISRDMESIITTDIKSFLFLTDLLSRGVSAEKRERTRRLAD